MRRMIGSGVTGRDHRAQSYLPLNSKPAAFSFQVMHFMDKSIQPNCSSYMAKTVFREMRRWELGGRRCVGLGEWK